MSEKRIAQSVDWRSACWHKGAAPLFFFSTDSKQSLSFTFSLIFPLFFFGFFCRPDNEKRQLFVSNAAAGRDCTVPACWKKYLKNININTKKKTSCWVNNRATSTRDRTNIIYLQTTYRITLARAPSCWITSFYSKKKKKKTIKECRGSKELYAQVIDFEQNTSQSGALNSLEAPPNGFPLMFQIGNIERAWFVRDARLR